MQVVINNSLKVLAHYDIKYRLLSASNGVETERVSKRNGVVVKIA